MDEIQSSSGVRSTSSHDELLYFWALGDLHYYDDAAWQAAHAPRMKEIFQDLCPLWTQEGEPAFIVSPGDIVEIADPEHYQLAREELRQGLGMVPFYPGVGNHEMIALNQESTSEMLDEFTAFWEKPPRYYWVLGEVLCIMLDVMGYGKPVLTPDSLAFLETALAKHPEHVAIIFAHCPLYGTVLDRDAERNLDYDSLEPFFYLENSDEVRDILARHTNVCLYLSGHTHAGWTSPHLVFTESLGNHPVTHVNLSSPWYTGRGHGVPRLTKTTMGSYSPDDPDMVLSWAIHVTRTQVRLRLRDHRAKGWLAEWVVPVH